MYIKVKKAHRTVTREISKYKFSSYMHDFPDGTPEKFKELTGKKPTQKEIKAYKKSIEPEKVVEIPEVDGSIDGDKDGATR